VLGAQSPDINDLLIPRRWRESGLRLTDIAGRFHFGYTRVSMACRRAERQLRSGRRLRANLHKRGIIDISELRSQIEQNATKGSLRVRMRASGTIRH